MCNLCVEQKPRDFRIIFIYFIFFVLFAGCINEWMVEISYRFKFLCVCVWRASSHMNLVHVRFNLELGKGLLRWD